MIQNYIIKQENNEEVLYLFLDYNYEFAIFNKNEKTFFYQLKDFLNNKAINFRGKKIILMVSGIIIGTIFLNNIESKNYNIPDNESKSDISYVSEIVLKNFNNYDEVVIKVNDETKELQENDLIEEVNKNKEVTNNITSSNNQTLSNTNTSKTISSNNTNAQNSTESNTNDKDSTPSNENPNTQVNSNTNNNQINNNSNENKTIVTVYRNNGSIMELELEEYLIGVVAGEMPASFNIEALKAQAIIARTYTLKSINQNKKLTDSVSTQVYIDNIQMKIKWGSDYTKYYNRIKNAVDSTSGMYITYGEQYIDAVYFSTSNGYTEDAKYVWGNNIPYLKTVESKWDIGTTSYTKIVIKSFGEISDILNFTVDENTKIENIIRNESNRISSITIGGQIYTGVQIRTLFNLNSTDFDIEITSDGFTFTTRGYGHGVGMSQYGANGMANAGYSYEEIIKYYYQGVSISK